MKQLFKYMSKPRDFFEQGFIRLSQLSALNDPFEASFCKQSLEELASHFDEPMALTFQEGTMSFSDYVETRMHNVGVISFSENKENLLMWAHYADEHRGIAAGIGVFPYQQSIFANLFRADSLLNTSLFDSSPFDGKPKPVSYRKGLRYKNDKFDYDYSNISAESADRILYEVFMQKSDEWIYEQEHRVVLRLEQSDRVIIPDLELIGNVRTREIIASTGCGVELTGGRYQIDLYKIQEDAIRVSIAIELTKLSKDPRATYLMRLDSSAINNCLIGLKSTVTKEQICAGHAMRTGYLDVWKANKNSDYYSLEFEQI